MKTVRDVHPMPLAAGSVRRIEGAKGLQVTALHGAVWLTQARDQRDVVLVRGQSFVLDREGTTIVYALQDAAIVLAPAGHIAMAPAGLSHAGAGDLGRPQAWRGA